MSSMGGGGVCIFYGIAHFYAHFLEGDKRKTKTKMDDLHQDSQTCLPTEYFALCSEHFEASCFSRSVLIGTPVDFKRKVQYHQYFAKPKDSLDTDYPRNEGRLANRFFPEKRSLDVSLGPYQETSVSKIPLQKKLISIRIGLAYSKYAFDLLR